MVPQLARTLSTSVYRAKKVDNGKKNGRWQKRRDKYMPRTRMLLLKLIVLVNINAWIRDQKSYLSHVSIVGA